MDKNEDAINDDSSSDGSEKEMSPDDGNDVNGNSHSGAVSQTLSLTSFLFGNIDACGQLEGDFFDPECKKQLASLSRLGLGSLLKSIDDDDDDDDEEDDDDDNDDQEEILEKSPSAIDYSDINEAVDDESDLPIEDLDDYDKKSDSELMPPPPPPLTETNNLTDQQLLESKKPVTPLAAMLPSKYQNVDVKELFPDFRQDSVLRFSRLFGPGKLSHLPRIWKHVKKKKKKKRSERLVDSLNGDSGSYSDSNNEVLGFDLCFGPEPSEDQCMIDDEVLLNAPMDAESMNGSSKGDGDKSGRGNKKGPREADWRFGPAQLWYDMLDVPAMGDGFDYGFKVQMKAEEDMETYPSSNQDLKPIKEEVSEDNEFPDDSFHMLTQYNWEDDIIWNGDDSKHKSNQKRKNMAAGWVPSSYNRTAQAFSQPSKPSVPFTSNKGMSKKAQILSKLAGNSDNTEPDDTWYSIFPVENEELVYDRWEDDIIWDPDDMDKIPEPKVLTLDPNDENIILGIPEDVDPASLNQDEAPVKVKIPHPHVKKSKILLGKAGVITTIEEESPPPPPKSPDKDPFNLSNDEFYQPKSTEQTIKMAMGGGLLQHSTPVVELQPPFVPTFMGEKKLRLFHRPPLKHYSHGALASPGSHPVHPLTKEIKKKAKIREQERLASGGGDVFFMRNTDDLSGKDGDLIMTEYCEEFPPILCQVGMCTRIKNYYKRKIGNDKGPPEYRFGETAYAHTSPFLGSMHPGQSIQTFENNMYRAPMYEHKSHPTDFLIIRTRNGYCIREIDSLYCMGQECPLYEVPGPNSKRANNFIRDFLQVFIYRLFWKSKDLPRRIKMDEIKRAYPAHSESSIRKRLKPCADFKRTGVDSNWWVIKPEFRLPTEDEIRAMVSPEQCAAFFSMLSAEQRLKDAGYGDKFLSALEDDNDDDTQKLDDEIKVAPWHTTRAYIQAVKGKCLLQLTGPADPTGCGEGFSYIRIPNKPTQNKEEQEQQPKRTVTGTDADLRKLSLNNAKQLLRNYGVPEEEIKKLTRWEVIDVVRTLSTEKAKAGEEGMNKFSRGNRFSIAEHQERYKEECQRVFDLQNRVLASEEVLSTDEGSSEEEENDSDMEEKGKYIENILANKKTSTQMTLEKEEQERKELQKMIMGEDDLDKKKASKKEEEDNSQYGYGTPGRLLRITRTFRSPDGKEYTRVETVRKTAVIDTYVKLRTTKDDSFIKDFAGQLDETQKEEIKRERRRLQEQLRRIKRNQERLQKGITTPPKTKKPKLKPDLKLKCGACGQVGHMRTNKACPMYVVTPGGQAPNTSSLSIQMEEPDEEPEKPQVSQDDSEELVNVDGTKIKLSSKVMKQAEELKRKSMSKTPRGDKGSGTSRGRRRAGTVVHCDYLKRKNKSVNRRRIDPVITLSTMLEEILNEMREMPDSQPFLFPVNAKQVPDYFNIIKRPMDLSTIREKLRQKQYQCREEFLGDINQIVENSKLYNGVNSTLTATSERMLSLCIDKFTEKEANMMNLEKTINPLLDDNEQVGFDFILDSIVNTQLFSMPEAWPFLKPVNKKNVKDYYEIIEHPMDLQTISNKVKEHEYHSREDFLHDIELIYKNSDKYNGSDSAFTQKAKIMYEACKKSLMAYDDHIAQLEAKIATDQSRKTDLDESNSYIDSIVGDEESNYTFAEPEGQSSLMDYSQEPETSYYGDEEDHVNVDVVTEDASPSKDAKNKPKPKRKPRVRKKSPAGGATPKKRKQTASQSNLLEQDLQFSDEEDNRGSEMYMQQEPMDAVVKIEEPTIEEPLLDFSHAFETTYQETVEQEIVDRVDTNAMMVDDSFDPSAAFLGSMRRDDSTINNDLAVSDSDDDEQRSLSQQETPEQGAGNIWF